MEVIPPAGDGARLDRRRIQARARRLSRRAETLADAGRVEEAIVCQTEVAALLPNDPLAFFRLGLLHREARQIGPAVDALRHVLSLSPGERDPREVLIETLLEANRYSEVITESKALARLAPRSLFARDILCVAYLQTGQIEKAVHVTGEMILLDPLSPAHHFKRAMLFQQQNNLRSAVSEFMRAEEMAVPGSEIYQDARDALRSLDEFQVQQIILLASEDRLFRTKMRQDAAQAVGERGFTLSEEGVNRLQMLSQHHFFDIQSPSSVSTWGGVAYYN